MRNLSESNRQPKLWTPVFVAVLAVTLCCFFVGQGLNAGTSVYLSRLGGTATLAGIGAATFSAAAAISRIVCGPLIDKRGRIAVVATGTVILLVGVLGSAFAANLDLFVLWRFLQGVGFATSTTAAATAAADVLPAERLGEGIGYYGLGQAVSMSFGPALALFLVSTEPPENLFWGLAVAAALASAGTALCRYERNPDRLPETATYRSLAQQRDTANSPAAAKEGNPLRKVFEPGALAGGLPIMVMAPAFGFGVFFAGLFGTTLDVGNAGIFYTVSAIMMIVVRLASGSFMDRTAAIRVFACAVVAGLVGFGMLLAAVLAGGGNTMSEALFYLAGIPYGLCLGLALPINQTVAVKNSPAERWGAANGLFWLLYDIGIGCGAALWGVTNDVFGFGFTICCVLALIAASFGAALLAYPAAEKR